MYKGIICDQADEVGRPLTQVECNECSLRPDRPCPFNGKILKMLWDDSRVVSVDSFSPTGVQGCKRQKYLEVQPNMSKYLYPYKKWHAVRGTAAHGFFENVDLAHGVLYEIKEVRMRTTVETRYGVVRFSGQPDLIEVVEDTGDSITLKLTDWKSTQKVAHDFLAVKVEHQRQVNAYAWLIQRCLPKILDRPGLKINIAEIEIVYFSMSKPRRFTTVCPVRDRGKLLSRKVEKYETIYLDQIEFMETDEMDGYIRQWIEEVIEAREKPADPLEGDAARLCPYCAYQIECKALWAKQLKGEVA